MLKKIKYSFSETILNIKKEKYHPLKHLGKDVGLIVLGGVLVLIPIKIIQIIGLVLVLFVVCLPVLIFLSSFYYFILTLCLPINKDKS
jgi:hypothetical protein